MSHEFESGFFVREPAWHGLGVVLEDAPTVEEGIRHAGLDWRVIERPVFTAPQGEDFESTTSGDLSCEEFKAILRETDLSVLGVVKRTWTPLQNETAFAFFNPFLAERDAALEAAGSLRNGRIIWVLAKLNNGDSEVLPGDKVENYLLLCNSHDGSMAVWVQFTAIRVVCMNTLSLALDLGRKSRERMIKIYHRGNVTEGLGQVQRAIDMSRKTFHFTLDIYRKMASYKFTLGRFKKYVQKVFVADELLVQEPERLPQCYEDLERLWRDGAGTQIDGVKDTLWGAYNAITEWTTHVRGNTDETRLRSQWFGQSANDNEKALNVARELVGVET